MELTKKINLYLQKNETTTTGDVELPPDKASGKSGQKKPKKSRMQKRLLFDKDDEKKTGESG